MPEQNLKIDEANNDFGEVLFSWKFYEFPQYERGKNWYIWAAVVFIGLMFFAIFNPQIYFRKPYITFSAPNLMFVFLIIIAYLIIFLFHRNNHEIEFKIAEDGILVNNKFYEYKKIKIFYIIYEPPEIKTLYFEPKSIFSPRLPIPLEDQNPVEIREILLKYLDEDLDRTDEPVSDQTSRMLKL